MAKLIVTETYEGTNEQIEQLQRTVRNALTSAETRSFHGEKLVRVEENCEFDAVETPLQKQLRSELEQIRCGLSVSLVAKAEDIIRQAGNYTSAAELITSLINDESEDDCDDESYDDDYQDDYFDEDELDPEAYDEDDCDEDEEEESFEQVLIRIILG